MASEVDAWRAGLQARGRDWVLAELSRRAGQPDEPLYDVVYEPPYPTREFCQRWCVEDDNKILRMSGTSKIAICTFIVLILVFGMAVHSLTVTLSSSHQTGAAQADLPGFTTARGPR